MKVVVIGGGFVGQLVQLAIPEARVLDWRKTAPANHLETRVGPQYLWEPIPGVKSESFPVTTTVDGMPPTPESILAYKQKIGKADDGGDWGLQFQYETIGWSSFLPKPRIEYNQTVRMVDLLGRCLGMADWTTIEYDLLINTIPMPAFLSMMIVGPEYRDEFRSDPIYMTSHPAPAPVEGMILNYVSGPDLPCYRETRSGHDVFYESLCPSEGSRRILPGKIHPHRENETILGVLQTYDCFCFGRFATWRPDELAHQTWKEIEQWKNHVGL
jgi:hypothetical protein